MLLSMLTFAADSNKTICNEAPEGSVNWLKPDPSGDTAVESMQFGKEYEFKWSYNGDIAPNIAFQILLPAQRLKNTIKVIGSATSFKWTPEPEFEDALTKETVTLQNSGGYTFALHDNSTRPNDFKCIGVIQDSPSKEISFFSSFDNQGIRRNDGELLSLSFASIWAIMTFIL